jgi:hypothetical protein
MLNPSVLEREAHQYTVGASIGLAMNTSDLPDEKSWLAAADISPSAGARQVGRHRSDQGQCHLLGQAASKKLIACSNGDGVAIAMGSCVPPTRSKVESTGQDLDFSMIQMQRMT